MAPNTSLVAGTFQGETIWALVIVLAASALVAYGAGWMSSRPRTTPGYGGLITGGDNRYSTSRAIAVGWTLVVAWMVVTEALIAGKSGAESFSALLKDASNLYFVFLGGPYLAAAFALASTQTKIAQGTIVKTPADSPKPGDILTDDNGNTDTYDFQYVLFNLLAIVIVVTTFAHDPASGLPDVPDFLAILTGGSALTYTVNKVVATAGPQITLIAPNPCRVGDKIRITGVQLFPAQAGGTLPTVTIGGITATDVSIDTATQNTLMATVAAPAAGTTPYQEPVDVVVTPPQATPIVMRRGVTVEPDSPQVAKVVQTGSTLAVTGKWLLAPGTAPGAAVARATDLNGLTATLTAKIGGHAFTTYFDGAYSNTALTVVVDTAPAGLTAPSGTDVVLILSFSRGGVTFPNPTEFSYHVP